MSEFNLVDQPWIPCIGLDGTPTELGIRDALLNAHDLREICDDSPLVTAALHRLLLAILYRALDGPADYPTWEHLYIPGALDRARVTVYLDKWRSRFYLTHDSYPFFQMARLETEEAVSITRLVHECASGNNATLFDHGVDEEQVEWGPELTARRLVACQAFALGIGKSAKAKIGAKEEARPYSADGIALRGMNVWLQGATLFNTLMINLAPTIDHSSPPWELDDPHQYNDSLNGKDKKTVAAFGVVDRLTWQSRLVRLLPNNGTFSRMYFTQGRSADKSPGDPMKVYRASKKEGISPLPLGSAKAAWRDAHSILMIPPADSNERRPDCLNLAARVGSPAAQSSRQFTTQIVGLASAPNKAAKFLLWRHERMPVPAVLLADVDPIERLGRLLQNAEQAARELGSRARRIANLYLAPNPESPGGRQADRDAAARVADTIDPRPAYWARMEGHFLALLENLPDDWDSQRHDWKPDDQQNATNTWRARVKNEARRALEESITFLGTTGRAIQAVARVRTDFSDRDLTAQPSKTKHEKRKRKGGKTK